MMKPLGRGEDVQFWGLDNQDCPVRVSEREWSKKVVGNADYLVDIIDLQIDEHRILELGAAFSGFNTDYWEVELVLHYLDEDIDVPSYIMYAANRRQAEELYEHALAVCQEQIALGTLLLEEGFFLLLSALSQASLTFEKAFYRRTNDTENQ